LRECDSKWTVVMDSDLQEDPALIEDLYNTAMEKNRSILVKNEYTEGSAYFYRIFQTAFYRLFVRFIDFEYDQQVANFGIYEKSMIEWISRSKDRYPFFPALVRQSGLNLGFITSVKKKRIQGRSGYSFRKLFSHAINIIFGQSTKIILILGRIGILFFIISILLFISIVLSYFFSEQRISGWYSLMSLMFLGFGLSILTISVVGRYIATIFEIILDKPIYTISEIKDAISKRSSL
jgi:hypothetical protein